MFVLPYLLLMVAWAMSNPPGAAPDESDHLVKALGVAQLEIGEPFTGEAAGSLLAQRNASISRVVNVPAQLAPDGFKCTAFKPNASAACLPDRPATGSGQVERVTPIGAYPPFLYLPAGVAAHLGSTPGQAFLLGRLAFSALSATLLFVGAYLLVKWLGRWSLLGAFVGLTPMAVFSSSILSTSGVEISAAFAVASAVVVIIRRPDALLNRRTQIMLAISGTALVLSRQLGMVTLGVLLLVMVARVGAQRVWQLLRGRALVFVMSFTTLVAACAAVLSWELAYDHPSLTGTPFSGTALRAFDVGLLSAVRSGVGNFGWLDTPLPQVALATWVILVVVLCAAAVLLARPADRWTLLTVLAASLATAYVVDATVFAPIKAGLQGRHMLPLFVMLPLLSAVVVVERLHGSSLRDALPRIYVVTGAVVGAVQLIAVYTNARRYAVGTSGPLWFLADSRWHPPLGWPIWLVVAGAGAIWLAVFAGRSHREAAFGVVSEKATRTQANAG